MKLLRRIAHYLQSNHSVIAAALCCALGGATAIGAEAPKKVFNVPGGDAATTLPHFARNSGNQIVYMVENVRGETTQPVRGEFAAIDALRQMLSGTGLFAVQDEATGAIVVSRRRAERDSSRSGNANGEMKTPRALSAATPPETGRPPDPPPAALPQPMNSSVKKPRSFFSVVAGWLAFATAASTPANGAEPLPPAAVIEGRVQNVATGQYLNNARVVVRGTEWVAFTDETGTYRLPRVPAGSVTLDVFYTGLDAQSATVQVAAGQSLSRDFDLTSAARYGANAGVVKLDSFVVASSRETDGNAIAINEQRFAPNIMNVVSADEFGAIADGNVGEFMKFLPGIAIGYVGGDARSVAMNGVPSSNVPVTVGGFNLASAVTDGNTSRAVELEQVSINNISRVEVFHSPTPESPGSALAGGVNLVPRSAFERSKPQFNGSASLMMRDNARSLGRTTASSGAQRKVQPGFDFSYVVPVNRRFGFTLSGSNSTVFTEQNIANATWRGVSAATNPAAGLPDTLPSQPYLTDYAVWDGTKFSQRSSVGTTVDFKLGERDRFSFSAQYSFFNQDSNNRILTFMVGQVAAGQFTTTSTRGLTGAGEIRLGNSARDKAGNTFMPSLTYRHFGPIWTAESGFGYSRGTNYNKDIDKGFFYNSLARRTGVSVVFDDIFYLRPRVISVTEGSSGTPVSPYDINNYVLSSGNSTSSEAIDEKRTFYANLRRTVSLRGLAVILKGGLDLRTARRDIRNQGATYPFVGADGRATTTPANPLGSDDGAGTVLDAEFSQRTTPFGFGQVQWVHNGELWDLYRRNPGYFTSNANSIYQTAVAGSKMTNEVVSAAYLRADLGLFDQRLKLVGGLRAEQTNVDAEGPLNDATLNYQRDAAGNVRLGANGRPLTLATDALEISKLTRLNRGFHARKEYLRWFPNLNASFDVRPNLVARASYYLSVGRPDYNQYSGGVTLPDTESPPAANNRITVNNAGIKAWSSETVKVRLEYYFEGIGQISIGGFRRDIENFFGATVFRATPEFLSLYGLEAETYGDYEVSTQRNLPGKVRMTGLEFEYRQSLTFLPHWARGVRIFANGTALRATGEASDNFSGLMPRSASWGASLTRSQFTLRLNWNYQSRRRLGVIAAGRSIEPGTYNWSSMYRPLDLQAEYYFLKRFAVFANLRNVTGEPIDTEVAGPSTPALAQFRQRNDIGSLWTMGVKGTF